MTHSILDRPFRKLIALGMAGALSIAAIGTALAAPAPQEQQDETPKHGYFGSVTAVGESTITIDTNTGQSLEVHVTGDTLYRAPRAEEPGLDDVAAGARVAVLVTEQDGVLTALHVMLVPGEPQRQHRVFTIVEVDHETKTVTAMDADGNTVLVEFDGEIDADLEGQITTFIGERSAQSNRFKANAEVKIRQVVERLQAHAERLRVQTEANAEARAQREQQLAAVEARLEANAALHVQRLAEVKERVPAQAKARLEAVLEATEERYTERGLDLEAGAEARGGVGIGIGRGRQP